MNFAVIKTGGKQYKVAEGEVLTIEKLPGVFKEGDQIIFNEVLLVQDGEKTIVGAPLVSGTIVNARFEKQGLGKKVVVVHYKQKSRYFKKNGHRQPFMKVKIGQVSSSGL